MEICPYVCTCCCKQGADNFSLPALKIFHGWQDPVETLQPHNERSFLQTSCCHTCKAPEAGNMGLLSPHSSIGKETRTQESNLAPAYRKKGAAQAGLHDLPEAEASLIASRPSMQMQIFASTHHAAQQEELSICFIKSLRSGAVRAYIRHER